MAYAAPPSDWQKSLRRSDGPNIIKAAKAKPAAAVRSKRLQSVNEEVFDENVGKPYVPARGNGQRRRLSTRESISEVDQVSEKISRPNRQSSPNKKQKALSFLRRLPACKLTVEQEQQRPIPSPIPLPPGVTNIDPDDDSTLCYSRDIFRYTEIHTAKHLVDFKKVVTLNTNKIEARREHLADWLIAVSHSFNCSQQTLYHTIDILDRVLERVSVNKNDLQLLGITAFLLATKLDEYYPADINKLCEITDNSTTPKMIRSTEQEILTLLNFQVYGADPMSFVNRYLDAAGQRQNVMTYELTILFLDGMMLNTSIWKKPMSIKVAICVLTALILTDENSRSIVELWSPTMKYYTGIEDTKEMLPTVQLMLKILGRIMDDREHCEPEHHLTIKYSSNSRHFGLLRKLTRRRLKAADLLIESSLNIDWV